MATEAIINYNIDQITNYDLEGKEIISHKISFPDGTIKNVNYALAFSDKNIIKLGYCCEPKGIDYPIFIKTKEDSQLREFKLGKTCMFEIQPEIWQDLSNADPEKRETDLVITAVQVPIGIKFTLDFANPIGILE